MLRYKSLRGHGFQAAVGPDVWKVLTSKLEVGFECFASPLNAYLPAYSSGFTDVDAPFGSSGSFFGLSALKGSFAANPPFVHSIMDAAAEHALSLLDAATKAQGDHALSFVFFLPGWTESRAYNELKSSPLLRRFFIVAASDHGFCDGASHQRKDPYRQSPYDTAIFVLQTDKASRKWLADDRFETELRDALALAVPLPSATKRQHKKRPPRKQKEEPAKPARKAPPQVEEEVFDQFGELVPKNAPTRMSDSHGAGGVIDYASDDSVY